MTGRNQTPLTLIDLEHRAKSGRAPDVDYLMQTLDVDTTLAACKMIDYALGLVVSTEGRDRIRHYLFDGSQIQRNYAALYFKRRGAELVLDEAVQRGCIDETQAYAK
jgi:hypothetical protein